MSDNMVRAFVAIELPEDVRNSLRSVIGRLRDRVASPDIKWVAPDNVHLTLKFLGQVPTDRIHEVQRNLEQACAASASMKFEVQTLGGFPSAASPRVIWAGLTGDIAPLTALANRIDAALAELGFPRESRSLTPHLTLARVRQQAPGRTRTALGTAIRESHRVTDVEFEADAVSLMRSQLTPGGAVYTRIAHLRFDPSLQTD